MIDACAVKAKPAKTRSQKRLTERVNLGDLGKRMSSAEGTEERVDDKGDSGTYCECEGDS